MHSSESDFVTNNPFPTDRIVTGSLIFALHGEGERRAVLLLKRSKMPNIGLWSPPGGKMELGESPEECAARELREETGLTVSDLTLRGVLTVYDRAFPIHWLLFVYRANVSVVAPDYPPVNPTSEGELRWIRLAEIDQFPRPYADTQYFPRVLDDSPIFQSKYVYDSPLTLVSEQHHA